MERLSYRQIQVDGNLIGVLGLDEVLAALYADGYKPDEALVPELLARVRARNYVAAAIEAEYGKALLREYRRFCERQAMSVPPAVDYGTWRGHPRESIPWYPTVNPARCDGCRACVRFCPNGVFALAGEGQIEVVEPFRCQVGCDACVRICKPAAITFPPQEMLAVFGT